jgi:hypothetical protein
VGHDHIFANELLELLHPQGREFAIVGDHFYSKGSGRYAGFALTDFQMIIGHQVLMKRTKHLFDLCVQSTQCHRLAKFVKKNGIAFDLRDLKTRVIRPYQHF